MPWKWTPTPKLTAQIPATHVKAATAVSTAEAARVRIATPHLEPALARSAQARSEPHSPVRPPTQPSRGLTALQGKSMERPSGRPLATHVQAALTRGRVPIVQGKVLPGSEIQAKAAMPARNDARHILRSVARPVLTKRIVGVVQCAVAGPAAIEMPDDWMCPDSDPQRLLIEQTVWQFGKDGVSLRRLAQFLNLGAAALKELIFGTGGQQQTAMLAVALSATPEKDDIRLVHQYHLGLEKRYTGAMGPKTSPGGGGGGGDDFDLGFDQYGSMTSS
jgi:hypothetical protein